MTEPSHLKVVHDESKVHVLSTMTINDVPAHLRALADEVEEGEYGDDISCFVMIPQYGAPPLMWGWGKASDAIVICNLELAKMVLLQNAMGGQEDDEC